LNVVRIINGALDETQEGQIILRGLIDPPSLNKLKRPDYQRAILGRKTIEALIAALKARTSRVPDIELAVRSGEFKSGNDHDFILEDDVWIIDGLQRVSAGRELLLEGDRPLIGCTVNFNTTEKWERGQFEYLNLNRYRKHLSPNIHIRNRAPDCPAIKMIYDLCKDDSFVLAGRVAWDQEMQRSELLTACTYLKTVCRLHSQFGPGKSSTIDALWMSLPTMMQKVGRTAMRDNIKGFFALLDTCWGIRNVVYKERATHLRGGFLYTLAEVIADHSAFWHGNQFSIDRDTQRKLTAFPLRDPSISAMCSTTSHTALLYRHIVDHINSGKRTKRLIPFNRREVGTRQEAGEGNGAA